MKIYSRVYARVDLDAIRHNLEEMKRHLPEKTKIMAVVKTDAYGHGAVAVAKEIEAVDDVAGFAVATAEEALVLRKYGIMKPILILGVVFEEQLESLILHDIRMNIFQLSLAEKIQETAKRLGKTAYLHVKLDTAMSRLGLCPEKEESIEMVKTMATFPNICLEGVFTHFAKADETDKEPSDRQVSRFEAFVERMKKEQITFPIQHCSNSAGIIDLNQYAMDMVRAGIALYGLYPSDEVCRTEVKLKPAMSLHSRIVYLKEIEAGVAVSYGGTFVSQRKTKVATIPVGYGDGYPRQLSNKGYVLIRGQKAPILGRVCMDQFMVDVTDIEGVLEGDEVVLFGQSQDAFLPIEELGDLSGRFNYEFLCDLGKRIPRVYVKDHQIVGTKDWFSE